MLSPHGRFFSAHCSSYRYQDVWFWCHFSELTRKKKIEYQNSQTVRLVTVASFNRMCRIATGRCEQNKCAVQRGYWETFRVRGADSRIKNAVFMCILKNNTARKVLIWRSGSYNSGLNPGSKCLHVRVPLSKTLNPKLLPQGPATLCKAAADHSVCVCASERVNGRLL